MSFTRNEQACMKETPVQIKIVKCRNFAVVRLKCAASTSHERKEKGVLRAVCKKSGERRTGREREKLW